MAQGTAAKAEDDLKPTSQTTVAELWDIWGKLWPVLLGNSLEWYDFALYGYLAPQIRKNFFRSSAVGTWLGFSVTYVMRPLGGLLFGLLADNLGRRPAVMITVLGMALATVGPGLLPTKEWGNENLGLGLLILCRTLQGLCVGGEAGSVASFVAEVSAKRSLGLAFAVLSMSHQLGFLVASGITAILSATLDAEQMLLWGWRIPFLVACPLGILSVISRVFVKETDAFKAQAEEHGGGRCLCGTFMELKGICQGWYLLVVGNLAALAYSVMRTVAFLWSLSAVLQPALGGARTGWVSTAAQLSGLVVTPLIGLLVDKRGVAWVLLLGSLLIFLTGLPVWLLLTLAPDSLLAVGIGLVAIWGPVQSFTGATIMLFHAELFPTQQRALGLGLTYTFSASIFGGFGPILAEQLFDVSPQLGPGLLLSVTGAVSLASVLATLLLRRHGVNVTYCREEPYFGAQGSKQAPCILETELKKAQKEGHFSDITAESPKLKEPEVLP